MAKYMNPNFEEKNKDLQYEENLIQYWGMKSAIETAVEEAVEMAIEENKIEIAKNLIALNLDNATIAKGTGLTIKQIEQLRNEIKKKK